MATMAKQKYDELVVALGEKQARELVAMLAQNTDALKAHGIRSKALTMFAEEPDLLSPATIMRLERPSQEKPKPISLADIGLKTLYGDAARRHPQAAKENAGMTVDIAQVLQSLRENPEAEDLDDIARQTLYG